MNDNGFGSEDTERVAEDMFINMSEVCMFPFRENRRATVGLTKFVSGTILPALILVGGLENRPFALFNR